MYKRHERKSEARKVILPSENQQIVKVTAYKADNICEVVDAEMKTFLVCMSDWFRMHVWIRPGDFIIIDPIEETTEEDDEVKWEVAHLLYNSQQVLHIQEAGLWPEVFGRVEANPKYIEDDLLPPSDSDDDEDLGTLVMNVNRNNQLYEQYVSSDEDSDEDEDEVEDEEEAKEEGEECSDAEETSRS